MKKRTGILLTADGDIAIHPQLDENGLIVTGLVIGDTLYQNQYLILTAQKGEFKEDPLFGVAIEDMTNDDDVLFWKKRIREEFKKDGLNVERLDIANGVMNLKANYL